MLAGLAVLVIAVIVVGVISNSSRLSSNAGKNLIQNGFASAKRSACITDLRNLRDDAEGQETDAVVNRLAVLDGIDPNTKEKLTISEVDAAKLAFQYSQDGLQARDLRIKYSQKLSQPTLNELCGNPVIENNDKKEG